MQRFGLPLQGRANTTGPIAEHIGPGCLWIAPTAIHNSADVGYLKGNKNGLTDTYRGHERGSFQGYWEPTMVDGYPAVFNGPPPDKRLQGDCNITVGISDTLTFRVSAMQWETKHLACERTRQVAAAVIATMKGVG
ncbi:uncharacterized protein DUF3558 [Herbihabitans rhizosphaerae]|uniref:Uncharacterized protein DUF3558 n=1 Tax=Herbihabitans rhizosphaerae TaxID=1872711 RepID=A0A4Q7L407_9PSEU|nr:uncharacterized protein DUF3558 [Herbihabitans rhizosphaerae]